MEPTGTEPAPELIVLTGRLKGSRCPLIEPLTLLGRDPACDIRLHLDDIAPLHAALIAGPDGPLLRELSPDHTVLVNGTPGDNRLLHDGDLLSIGPFQFQVSLPPGTGTPPVPGDEALRLQAAAVAAEQVRLSERETQLDQRRLALETQEKQLVAHLEERRGQLEAVQQQVETERQRWREERAAEEAILAEHRTALALEREQLARESRDLDRLCKTLQERHDQHWKAQEEALARRERDLASREQAIERERDQLGRDRQAALDLRVRLNTEQELTRRQLREEWEKLQLAQQQWEVVLHHEEQERRRHERSLQEREAALAFRRADLAEEKQRWHRKLVLLQKEARGLENRVRAQRKHLRPPPTPVILVPPATPVAGPLAPPDLCELAAELADQRLHLAEQWQRLVEQQEAWEADKAATLAQLEEVAANLVGREQAVATREAETNQKHEALLRRERGLDERQDRLEGFETRLRVQALDQAGEQARRQAEVAAREEAIAGRIAQAEARTRTESNRLRKTRRRLRHALRLLGSLHLRYAALWREQEQARRTVLRTQQEMGRQQLALQRLRDETLTGQPDVPAAERRLERLAEEYAALWAREEKDLKAEWQALDREREVLDALGGTALAKLTATLRLVRRQEKTRTAWAERRGERERRRAENAARARQLEADRIRAEQQAEALRAELERIALNLLGENTEGAPAAESQAA